MLLDTRKLKMFRGAFTRPFFYPSTHPEITVVRARRVLVLIQARRCAPRTSTRLAKPNPTEIRKKRGRTGAASPLNRLAIAARIPFLHFPFLSRICTSGSQFDFGICRITSLLTAPMSTPSSQQRKSSYRSSFLSSSPNGQTTSSSIISERKYCGKPLE